MKNSSDPQIKRVFSRAPWEAEVGYCRAIRMGHSIAVTGTTSLDENAEVHAPGEAYFQAKRCLEIIERAASSLGASHENILRTRMVEIKSLIDPRMLIEIEADAVLL